MYYIYDYLCKHRLLRWGVLLTLTTALALLAMRLTYKEDIRDFLPLDEKNQEAMDIYQDISGADQLVITFQGAAPDTLCSIVDRFCQRLSDADTAGWTRSIMAGVDMDKIAETLNFVYENIPYFLSEKDYARIDSLFAQPDYISNQLRADREALLYPSAGVMAGNIGNDPLNLFEPTVKLLSNQHQSTRFETYNGYLFTPDMQRVVVTLCSPFGNAETHGNALLIKMLREAADNATSSAPHVEAHIMGGPCIAVENAERIKKDSVLAISLSAVLIITLLIFCFRSWKGLVYIIVSVVWGWLFALGLLSVLRDSVSVIVLGMASVIIGIAINYPLHYVTHAMHEKNTRNTLREISAPLIIGNVTTVGAFMALVPLDSVALRDLGLFASLLLVGTIIFVLVFLPHLYNDDGRWNFHFSLFTFHFSLKPSSLIPHPSSKVTVGLLALLTIFFGYYALQTEFDPDVANINYVSDLQKTDMEYMQRFTGDSSSVVYIVSSAKDMEQALEKAETSTCGIDEARALHTFLPSGKEQQRRLAMWHEFLEKHGEHHLRQLDEQASQNGFSPDAFEGFRAILNKQYAVVPYKHFSLLTNTFLAGNISIDEKSGRHSVVIPVGVKKGEEKEIEKLYAGSFDVKGINKAMTSTLSDNFNYIGIVCSAIVFLFLWLSFSSLRTAIIAFIPMAVSWVWILGIMALVGLKFNIVNIILATFIFGQGDDYTIFVTEGLLQEQRTGKPMLASYRRGIILSALIMLAGIGSLITAQHPALRSLAGVTIVGMGCVVVMALVIPPLLMRRYVLR